MAHARSPDIVSSGRGGLVSVENLTHTFATKRGQLLALDDISLHIKQGEFVSIVGPSGCGKSTLMRVVAGLLQPSGGRVAIGSEPVTRPHPGVGVVFQRAALLPWRDVIGNITMQLEMRDLDLQLFQERVQELIRLTGLVNFERALPHELSGGMQQRVSLCRALIHDPDILLMDEPFGALDAMTREAMNLELQRIWMQKKKTVMFITHSIAESVLLSDRVVVMSARPGRVLKEVRVDLPRPRNFQMLGLQEFIAATDELRRSLDAVGLTQ